MFEKYVQLILNLPDTEYEKFDILNENFELYSDENLKIYFAPHNEFINKQAKVFIVGITLGWTQTKIAYEIAKKGLNQKLAYKEIKQNCKKGARFAGSMRKNIITMLDEIDLNKKLHISSCSELFEDKDYLLHTTSVIPYPVFINGKNYTGNNPSIIESEILYKYVEQYFYKEAKILKDALIIPLGKSVQQVLEKMVDEKIIKEEQCLFGFPHPSGANGHRIKQFERNNENLKKIVYNYII